LRLVQASPGSHQLRDNLRNDGTLATSAGQLLHTVDPTVQHWFEERAALRVAIEAEIRLNPHEALRRRSAFLEPAGHLRRAVAQAQHDSVHGLATGDAGGHQAETIIAGGPRNVPSRISSSSRTVRTGRSSTSR
jgi:hypothetical protein